MRLASMGARGRRTGGRLALAVALAGALAGCGFEPLYGRPDGRPSPVAAELAGIQVAPIADRRGQLLRDALEERLTPSGEPARPAFTLGVTLEESIETLVFRRDASPTRANLSLTAEYRLRPAGAEGVVTGGRARTVIGYNISGAEFATLVAEGDARERAVRELAIEISARLASHFAQAAARR